MRGILDRATGLFDADAFGELAGDRLQRGVANGGRTAVAVLEIALSEQDPAALDRAAGAVASAIRAKVRSHDLAARSGERAFTVLLDRCEREDAKHVCARILRAVVAMGGPDRLSCGIAVAPENGTRLEELASSAARRMAVPRIATAIAATG